MEIAAGGSALSALRAFSASLGPHTERKTGGGCCPNVLSFPMTPLSANEEFSHEIATGFLFSEEMKIVRQLQSKCEEGRELVKVIYCSRSCARAFPPVVVADEADPTRTKQYYRAIFTVLQPQVEKIKQLSDFCSQAVVLLSDNIQRITVHENMTRVIPDVLMDALVDIMDVILQLNHLHDTKSSLRNDFSVFKRVFINIKDDLPDAELVEKDIVRLQESMGSSYQAKDSIWDSLRHNLTNVKRYDQVTYLLLKHCVTHAENDTCTTPCCMFKFIRVLSYLLVVLEGSDVWKKTGTLPGGDKKIIEAAGKFAAKFPVIPVIHEVSIKPVKLLSAQSGGKGDPSLLKQRDALFDIVAVSRDSKITCEVFLPRLIHALNTDTGCESTKEQHGELYDAVVDGIGHLHKWKSSFLLFLAWKYQNPKTDDITPVHRPHLDYEHIMKHNFLDVEWQAMADVIYGVKSVVQIFRDFQQKIAKCVRRAVYYRVQAFVQHTLLPILHRADKRKLACTKLLHDIRTMCGDWVDSELLTSDFKKKHKDRKFPQIPDRTASPSLCQVQMLRTAVDSMYTKRSMGDLNGKTSSSSALFSFKKDLDSSDAQQLRDFYHEAEAFSVVLNLSTVIDELGDFSCVWFRELYLELAKTVQIPPETSLPWLLIEHCLDTTMGAEPVLAILDAYNDAANISLNGLRQQWLYDEIEAEGKLCFDHLMFLLAERIYLHYKTIEAQDVCRRRSCHNDLNDGSRQSKVSNTSDKSVPLPTSLDDVSCGEDAASKYEFILAQRQINIFGRRNNLSFQLGQRIDALLRKDVEGWFTKLETSDVTCYVALRDLQRSLKNLHASLSVVMRDDFEDVEKEANDESLECLSASSISTNNFMRSRVHDQVSQRIQTDLCQHFSLKFDERRFVRMPLHLALMMTVGDQAAHEDCLRRVKRHRFSRSNILRNKVGNVAAARAAAYGVVEKTITGVHRDYFGEPHVAAIFELLTKRELLDIVDECINFATTKIEDVLALCIPALGSTIPPFRLPRFMYRTEGCYGYFEGKFKYLLDSDELEAQVFHCLREIGNSLMFVLLVEQLMVREVYVHTTESKVDQEKSVCVPELIGNGEHSMQLFKRALARIDDMLVESEIAREWEASPDSHPEKMPNPSSFYHVWSALEFLSCTCPRVDTTVDDETPLSLRDMFGDGVQLAGCTLVHLLGQRTLYDLWNVSQHILNVRHHEEVKTASDSQIALALSTKKNRLKGEPGAQPAVGALGIDMEYKTTRFVTNARKMRDTSKRIFDTLEIAWPSAKRTATTFLPPAFVPPVKPFSES